MNATAASSGSTPDATTPANHGCRPDALASSGTHPPQSAASEIACLSTSKPPVSDLTSRPLHSRSGNHPSQCQRQHGFSGGNLGGYIRLAYRAAGRIAGQNSGARGAPCRAFGPRKQGAKRTHRPVRSKQRHRIGRPGIDDSPWFATPPPLGGAEISALAGCLILRRTRTYSHHNPTPPTLLI